MRINTKWTPSGIVLWIIAAIIATLVICSQAPPPDARPEVSDEVEFEVESTE